MMDYFYSPDISGDEVLLDNGESVHCIRVLRHRKGDSIVVVDGNGGKASGIIEDASQRQCRVKITGFSNEALLQGHIAVSPPKSRARLEWFLEKAAEIGIGAITPFFSTHSERSRINSWRCIKVMISAMKQSQRACLPRLHEAVVFEELIDRSREPMKFIAVSSGINGPGAITGAALVLIGPEGGFSPAEEDLARQKGFQPVSLGSNRLRTETAALAVCVLMSLNKQ